MFVCKCVRMSCFLFVCVPGLLLSKNEPIPVYVGLKSIVYIVFLSSVAVFFSVLVADQCK